jgi:hypothetical protein
MKDQKKSPALIERINEVEACQMLGITPPFKDENGKLKPGNRRKIRQLVREGHIIAYTPTRNWQYNKMSIEEFIVRCQYSNLPVSRRAVA